MVANLGTQFTEISVLNAAHIAGIIPDHRVQHWRGNAPPPFVFCPLDIVIKARVSDSSDILWKMLKTVDNGSKRGVSRQSVLLGDAY